MAEDKKDDNQYSTFQWVLKILTCTASCGALLLIAIALIILISEQWTKQSTITAS